LEPNNRFIDEHSGFVHRLAGKLQRELSLAGEKDDLVAFGYGGLLEARQRFDPSRGIRFQTFAYHRVRGAMLDGVRQMARLPRRAHEKIKSEASGTVDSLPRPTALDKSFHRMSAMLTMGAGLPASNETESPEAKLLRSEGIARVTACLAKLPSRERRVVRAVYFEGRKLDDIAADLGISKSWASRLHTKALAELRQSMDEE
jgi:RNA polymerase sigma factor for flagellar operon FliA